MKTGKTTGKRTENTRGLLLLAAMTMLLLAATGGAVRAQEATAPLKLDVNVRTIYNEAGDGGEKKGLEPVPLFPAVKWGLSLLNPS